MIDNVGEAYSDDYMSMNSIRLPLFDCDCFRFSRERSNGTRNRSAEMVMSDPSARTTVCRLLNGYHSMRQSYPETRTYLSKYLDKY